MSVGARCGFGAAVLSLLLCTSAALAQANPPAEAGRTWTDPPVRGSASPQAAPSRDASPKAAGSEGTAARGATVKSATTRDPDAPAAVAKRTASAPEAPPVQRSAKLRRERIREASRSRMVAEAPAQRSVRTRTARVQVEEPHRTIATPRRSFVRRDPWQTVAQTRPHQRVAWRYAQPVERRHYAAEALPVGRAAPYATAYPARGYDWSGGVFEDDRTRRIRQARAAGFLVVRSRSVELPDGRRLQSFRHYEVEDEDELE